MFLGGHAFRGQASQRLPGGQAFRIPGTRLSGARGPETGDQAFRILPIPGDRGPVSGGQEPGFQAFRPRCPRFPHCFQGPGGQAFRRLSGGQVPGCVSFSIIYILPTGKMQAQNCPFSAFFSLSYINIPSCKKTAILGLFLPL